MLELPKFTQAASELRSRLEVWLYFLRHAEKMDTDAVPAALKQPLVRQALEELKMLSQTDLERERYEARRKAQLDYNTGLKVARLEGREEGREEGRLEGRQEGLLTGRQEGQRIGLVGMIHLCERMLGRPETPAEQLTALSLDDLTHLADDLQGQVPKTCGSE